MRYKKTIILAILLVSLLTVSAVSAADNTTSDIVSVESQEDVVIGEVNNNLTSGIDDNILSSNPKTFTDLNALINDNEDSDVYLKDNYTFNANSDSEFIDGVHVNRAVTVHGNGYTINGNNAARIFHVELMDGVDGTVVFKDIIFKNGNSSDFGGAICGNITDILIIPCSAMNCTFVGNSAYEGGAISGGYAVNCTFINNSAVGEGSCGGAINSDYENCSAVNCTFVGNSADYSGAMHGGSAVNCTFVGNSAVYAGAMSGDAVNCTFINNSAVGEWSGGGAMSGDAVNCTFVGNSARANGGAMFGNCAAVNCTFINNTANDSGAMFGNCAAVNCTFVGNSARTYYGAMSDGSAVNCAFINNTADTYGAMSGDAVNCTFVGNSAGSVGGAMSGDAVNCTFVGNSAYNGGAIGYGSAVNCTFVGNSARTYGGAMYEGSAVNCTFVGNVANKAGGAAYECELTNCIFKGESAGSGDNDVYPKLKTVLTAKYDKDTKNIVATVKDANGKAISGLKVGFAIDGVKYVTTNANGEAKYSTSGLADKKYSVNVRAYGNDLYTDSNKVTVTFDLSKIATTLTAPDIITTYNSGKNLVATLKDSNGKAISGAQVTIKLGTETKTLTTDKNGQVSMTTNGLDYNTYIATITFAGDDTYSASSTTAKVTITKEKQAKIYLRNALYFVLQTKMVQVTLWDANNNPIAGKTVYINLDEYGLKYSGVTDESGNAYIRVGVGFGNHPATVRFEGDDQYNPDSKTGRVRVIKETPSLMLPGAYTKFKATDPTKTIKVYLKDRYNKPLLSGTKVFVKINGKQYLGSINNEGIASININLNKVGVYDVELYYTGNTKYNAVRKNTKISIV